MPDRDRDVYLHVGPPKTGTTYLQDLLWRNRGQLSRVGVSFPGKFRVAHFHAALDLRGVKFGGFDNPDVYGAWPRLVQQVASVSTPTAVVSHEVFAGAPDEAIARAVSDLAPARVHVIYGARDLGRQLPAVWQETLKNRSRRTYRKFLRRVLAGPGADGGAHGFWRAQDTVATLQRWSRHVPADRIHVVTLPPEGAPPDTLWSRFCRAIRIDPAGFDLEVARPNPSLRALDAELLRRLNRQLPEDLPWPEYERLVKRRFNQRADARLAGEKLRVPLHYRARVQTLAGASQEAIISGGYEVVGDLADLTPAASAFGKAPRVSNGQVAHAAIDLLAEAWTAEGQGSPRSTREAVATILGRVRRGSGRGGGPGRRASGQGSS